MSDSVTPHEPEMVHDPRFSLLTHLEIPTGAGAGYGSVGAFLDAAWDPATPMVAGALEEIGRATHAERVTLLERLPVATVRRHVWARASGTVVTADEDPGGSYHRLCACIPQTDPPMPVLLPHAAAAAEGEDALLIAPIMQAGAEPHYLLVAGEQVAATCAGGDYALPRALAQMLGRALAHSRLDSAQRAREAHYLAIINEQSELVCRCAPTLALTFVNEAFCRFFAKRPHELLGVSLLALLPASEHDEWRAALAALTPDAPTHQSERQAETGDGIWSWLQWSDRATYTADGQLLEYQLVGREITARKYVEEELREREERYRAIVNNAALGICLVDAYGQFLECNPTFVQMTGYPPEELVMLTLSQVTHAADWDREQRQFTELWEGKATGYTLEKRLVTEPGALEWVQAMTTVVRDPEGVPQYAVQLLENISTRKEAERVRREYEERLRALTLNATLSEERERRRIAQNLHDQIGQSLAIARMQLGKLCAETGVADPGQRGQIEEIRTLLSEALDYSRTVTCELSPPILHELGLVPALRWLARHFTERYHLPTELEADVAMPAIGHEERVVLYHTARELLFNVVKHAQATRAIIGIQHARGAIMLTVEDDGCGFTPAPPGTGEGGGFGLFSVRERVGQLWGTFTIDSAPGRGTRCLLRMPLGAAPPHDRVTSL